MKDPEADKKTFREKLRALRKRLTIKRLLGMNKQRREVINRNHIRRMIPNSFFTKKDTPGRRREARDALMSMTTLQRAWAMQTWRGLASMLSDAEWREHAAEMEELKA